MSSPGRVLANSRATANAPMSQPIWLCRSACESPRSSSELQDAVPSDLSSQAESEAREFPSLDAESASVFAGLALHGQHREGIVLEVEVGPGAVVEQHVAGDRLRLVRREAVVLADRRVVAAMKVLPGHRGGWIGVVVCKICKKRWKPAPGSWIVGAT